MFPPTPQSQQPQQPPSSGTTRTPCYTFLGKRAIPAASPSPSPKKLKPLEGMKWILRERSNCNSDASFLVSHLGSFASLVTTANNRKPLAQCQLLALATIMKELLIFLVFHILASGRLTKSGTCPVLKGLVVGS